MATPAQLAAVATLGNGTGYIYVTDATGTLQPRPDAEGYPFPQPAKENIPLFKGWLQREVLPRNSKYNASAYASAVTTITATAGNLTAFNVNGVNQIAAPIAMTGVIATDLPAIVAAINAHSAALPNDFRATLTSTNNITITETTAGDFANGWVVALTFSVASTWTSTVVGGGRDVGGRPYRIFVNASLSATSTSLVGAEEITDLVSFHGLEAPGLSVDVAVATNAVSFVRLGALTTVYIDGVTSVGAANEVNSFTVNGAVVNDEVVLTGIVGAGAPAILKTGAFAALDRDVTLTDDTVSVKFRFNPDGTWAQVTPSPFDLATLRANGVAVPLQEGVFQLTPTNGTATITPGSTGVSAFPGIVYEHDVVLTAGAVLGAAMNFTVDATGALQGDTGTISGNNQAVTGDVITFSDNTGIRATLSTRMAATGRWTVVWTVNDVGGAATVSFSVVPDFGTAHTLFLDTAMYADLSVTNGKIADATIVGSTKLVDASVTEAKLDALVAGKLNVQGRNRITLSIPTAEVLTLFTVPKLAVPAPGAGFAVLVEQVTAQIAYAGVIYATNVNLQVKFTGAGEAVAESSSFLVKTANAIVNIPLMYTVGAAVNQILENTDLVVTVETGDPTAGTSNIWVYIDYSILAVN